MSQLTLENNEFLRQFEVVVNGSMARIEYAEQERKIFLTKLIVPEEIESAAFKDEFIKIVLDFVAEKNMRVVPTSPEIAGFLRKNKSYKDLLPVGIKL
ncbi:MAG: N-acetyltransferase [Flavobacteriaceae bacterium]|jgi:predicted GNAT family acetyltransferase|uniref:GNAT family N-acetyltransferase n=1 Tax=Candidatus Arcticimaribacter forsetii TaxID=2820661 RepID=UPI00207723BB|nr:N-acetyltransferase [Candidatus Arcticimaribacter forsetii]MCH1538872.1 N-acetyltransferase [Flavobacteriaceae bacterium]MDA8639943.1 N-acetyltransferase [Flavobacteriaceae bacterium]MDB2325530.1 N-acetyltransferase [Flavobacteriaceae bacterium]MDB2329125.1 N-acetyltransferase [Flavobacteriaceae bacterium]MDB2456780.1 N-acetyltransferase [Flavobacteriaceae bacterium]